MDRVLNPLQAFRNWMSSNSISMQTFERLARERVTSGQRFGVRAFIERCRWEGVSIDNIFVTHLMDELELRIPGLSDALKTRTAKTKERRSMPMIPEGEGASA